jgi:hexokinase
LTELKRLEEMFIVDREKLKIITQRFVGELEKGESSFTMVSADCRCKSSTDEYQA